MAFISNEHTEAYIADLVARSRAAQRKFEADYKDQRAIDEVVRAVGLALVDHADDLSMAAVSETGMGNLEGKKRKLVGSAACAWRDCRGVQSVGYKDCPGEPGVQFKFKPMGVIGAVMPSTNPLATILCNSMFGLKCRNSIIIAPHPSSAHVSDVAIGYIQDRLESIGAPRELVLGISAEEACVEATDALLHHCDVNIGTGGPGMVKAVYSSGKPAYGVGQGNCQEIIDKDIPVEEYDFIAANIMLSRPNDNGVPCTGDQTVYVPEENEEAFVKAMVDNGAYLLEGKEKIDAFRDLLFPNGGTRINRQIVGRVPHLLGEMFGEDIPESAKLVLLKNQAWGEQDVLCREILAPVLRYTTYKTFEEAVDHAVETLYVEGAGHSSSLWTKNEEHVDYASDRFPVGRFKINMPTGGGSIPCGLKASATIGCGTWGGNSISEYLQWYHLYNMTKVARPVSNLRPFDPMKEFDNYEPWVPTID